MFPVVGFADGGGVIGNRRWANRGKLRDGKAAKLRRKGRYACRAANFANHRTLTVGRKATRLGR